MKKRILVLVLIISLSISGCSTVQAADLMSGLRANRVEEAEDLASNSAEVTDFAIRLFQESMENDKSTLISPLSVLCALSMTANGADGNTLAQMEEVFGLPVDTLNGYLHSYIKQLPQEEAYKLSLANSVWFKDDPNLTVEQSFLQTNADYYGASAYKTPFDDTTLDAVNRWVEENTNGMVRDILDKIPEDAVMYLINALAFDAQWQEPYEEYQIRNGFFTTEAGEEQEMELMHSTEHKYLEDDNATGFIKYFDDRAYAFVALLPNEGISVAEYVDSLTGANVNAMLSGPEEIIVYAAMPKFETEYDVEMREVLKAMGMTDAFDWTVADFSRLGAYTDLYICIDRVIHKTHITVDAQGTRAGAATVVEMTAEGAAMPPEEYKAVTLDRPFVYMLIDCETNLPFFIGTMMDVNAQ